MGKRKREKDESHKSKRSKKEEIVLGYSNVDNPFGDTNLTNRFVWHKKIKQDREKGKKSSYSTSEKSERKRVRGIQKELEKAKQRREEREQEKQQWEEEMARLERERNKYQWDDWESKEITFHLQQAKKRSELRIGEGRPKAIDWIYHWVTLGIYEAKNDEKPKFYPLRNPSDLLPQVPEDELLDLQTDLNIILKVLDYKSKLQTEEEREAHSLLTSSALPETLLVLVEHELAAKSAPQKDVVIDPAQVHKIDQLLRNRTSQDLEELQVQIKDMLSSGGAVDVGFWEAVLNDSHLAKAKAKLLEVHKELVVQRNALFRSQGREATEHTDADQISLFAPTEDSSTLPESDSADQSAPQQIFDQRRAPSERILPVTEGEMGENTRRLEEARILQLEQNALALCERSQVNTRPGADSTEELMLKRETDKGFEQNEEIFSSEVVISRDYDWHDQYRPRKPKYFNRIKTGYEWNRYNQMHYDHDNPPPKIIQGYKFNVFYPDLINPNDEPTYFLERSDDDTTIIRFHAGPPYEDIAFRIVNREWERSHRKGYRCCFEKGILQLWFNFKRYRYRR